MKHSIVVWTAFLTLPLFWTSLSWSHGENKLGPHGGSIRMPGAFHTEVKQESANRLSVYLLDIHFKNPVTLNSSVAVELKRGETVRALSCVPKKHRFLCALSEIRLKPGDEIVVKASRESANGVPVTHPFPFKPN